MRNITFVFLLAALLAVLLRRTTQSAVHNSVEASTDAKFEQIVKRAQQYKRTVSLSPFSPCDSCKIPEVQNVQVITGNKVLLNNDRAKMTAYTKCAPHPIPVRIPSIGSPTLPYVSLHRCLGSDSYLTGLGFQCKVKTKETISVEYEDILQGFVLMKAVMYNHTDCFFDCQKQTCGPNQQFQMKYCGCQCMITAADCLSSQRFDANDCTCKCIRPIDCMKLYSIYARYNYKTCKCECDPRLKAVCTEGNQDFDTSTCKCKPKTTTV